MEDSVTLSDTRHSLGTRPGTAPVILIRLWPGEAGSGWLTSGVTPSTPCHQTWTGPATGGILASGSGSGAGRRSVLVVVPDTWFSILVLTSVLLFVNCRVLSSSTGEGNPIYKRAESEKYFLFLASTWRMDL